MCDKDTRDELTTTNVQLESRIPATHTTDRAPSIRPIIDNSPLPINSQLEHTGREEVSEVDISESPSVRYSGDTQSNIWKGLLDQAEVANLINLMKTDEVVSSQPIYGSSTGPMKITLKSGIVGIFKPASKNDPWTGFYESEIAAYEVDKALGLNMVPITVEREIKNEQAIVEKGSFQLWVDNLVPGNAADLPNEVHFFDLLIANNDRANEIGAPNYKFLASDQNRPVLFDNANSFNSVVTPPTSQEIARLMPKADFLGKVQQLNVEEIMHLRSEQRDSLLERRNMLVEAMKQRSTETY